MSRRIIQAKVRKINSMSVDGFQSAICNQWTLMVDRCLSLSQVRFTLKCRLLTFIFLTVGVQRTLLTRNRFLQKPDHHNPFLVSFYWKKKKQINIEFALPHLPSNLHVDTWRCKSRANVAFAIFAPAVLLICTFLPHIFPRKISYISTFVVQCFIPYWGTQWLDHPGTKT